MTLDPETAADEKFSDEELRFLRRRFKEEEPLLSLVASDESDLLEPPHNAEDLCFLFPLDLEFAPDDLNPSALSENTPDANV